MTLLLRRPAEETEDYPGLTVMDNRVTGSICVGPSRLPLWAIITTAVSEDWEQVEQGWSPTEHYGFTERDLNAFLYNLLENRGELGRLILILADGERRGWRRKDRKRLAAQLRRCLDALDPPPADPRDPTR